MSIEFNLPDLGQGITEAQVIRVMIREGDDVAEDQYVMQVETDKAVVEIPSPYAGKAGRIHVKEGDTVNVGAVIVTFDDKSPTAFPARATRFGDPMMSGRQERVCPRPRCRRVEYRDANFCSRCGQSLTG